MTRLLLLYIVLVGCSSEKPSPPSDDITQAETNFQNICAKCHGQDGRGGVPLSDGGPPPRNFTDAAWQASLTDAQIEATIRSGKPPMPAFDALLPPSQVRALVAKIRRFGKGDTK